VERHRHIQKNGYRDRQRNRHRHRHRHRHRSTETDTGVGSGRYPSRRLPELSRGSTSVLRPYSWRTARTGPEAHINDRREIAIRVVVVIVVVCEERKVCNAHFVSVPCIALAFQLQRPVSRPSVHCDSRP
jgi:hypothetical protein